MRILVTGGSGFIGSNFLHYALFRGGQIEASRLPGLGRYSQAGEPVEVLNLDKLTYAASAQNTAGLASCPAYRFAKGDICDPARVNEVLQAFEPDVIVHFAAESHVDRSIQSGQVFVETNVLGTQVLLDAARRHEVASFLHVSTDEVYGSIDEGSFVETDPYHASSPYSASKAGSDLLVLAHHHTYGSPVTITRCTNNYGPHQHPEKLLPKVITLAAKGEKLPIYGTGQNVRDWLYVLDHCAALETVLQQRDWGGIYNVGARDERANLDVVKQVLHILGKPESLIEFVTNRPGHDWRYSLDDSKLRALGWTPQTLFDDGLANTMAWLLPGAIA